MHSRPSLDGGYEAFVTEVPRVALVSEQDLRHPPIAEALSDYHKVERRVDYRGWVMARPLTLALVMRAGVQARNILWAVMRWAYDKGLISTNTPEGVGFCWRDLRPLKMGKR